MMKEKTSMGALIAAKIVCCGALLVATGVVSLASVASIAGSPVVQGGGIVALLAAAGWMFARQRGGTCATARKESEWQSRTD
jgi:hypothetical protein